MQSRAESRRPRRTANACTACRQSKIKCSGKRPCENCQRRSATCQFSSAAPRVVVSGAYLDRLRRRANRLTSHSPTPSWSDLEQDLQPPSSPPDTSTRAPLRHGRGTRPPGADSDNVMSMDVSEDPGDSRADTFSGPTLQSPGDPELRLRTDQFAITSRTVRNFQKDERKWLWLSPWSTWSFTVRLMLTLGEALRPASSPLPDEVLAPDIPDLPWRACSASDVDISGLPSERHALFLLDTVKFHLGQTYRLLNEDEFSQQVRDFYADSCPTPSPSQRVWYAKFLLVLAFGLAFQAPQTSGQGQLGRQFFTRAVSLMPDPSRMWKESLLGIEILALTSLYLFCVDERESAHSYLGNAIRFAQMEGLHTQLPQEELGIERVTYCRDLWWTLYIMDRHFSSSVGLPPSVHDSDISTPFNPPNVGSQSDSVRSLQVNLSHLLSVILTTVYVPAQTSLVSFLEQTRSILHTLAHHAQEIERIIGLKFEKSPGAMPKETHYVTMLYHQCVIVATRPPLLSVLKERLESLNRPDDEKWDSLLDQTATIIYTGIKSAVKTLEILSKEYNLLEVFLPYDRDFAFGAGLHLAMAMAVVPDAVQYQPSLLSAHRILDELAFRGSHIAKLRTAELKFLESLCIELAEKGRKQGYRAARMPNPDAGEMERMPISQVRAVAESVSSPHGPMGENMDFLDSIGISAVDLLSVFQDMPDFETLPESMLNVDL